VVAVKLAPQVPQAPQVPVAVLAPKVSKALQDPLQLAPLDHKVLKVIKVLWVVRLAL
jgi:hypothetical protein